MDNVKLQEEVNALKNLGEHLESQLKMIGFELCDLPDDVSILLDNCVDIQMETNLHELNINYLREYYYTKKRETIENKQITAQQTAELKKLKDSIEETDKDIKVLEKFKDKLGNRLMTEPSLQRNLITIEGKAKSLRDRQKNFVIQEDFNIDALIDKVGLLESRRKKADTK
ncbi:augmin complex subunit wac isoform X2 [Drosophila sulfurigaster albostrigata]|uniref:augmin complex subunit wac isoform X2 n=1 Tax=Drosophila sulfurigaster albostrigata TaxID=89887 RepID=UPI002D21C50A|nr:augmin complex subunit wac isoform X2 [Drosophila sulfurigaster albostrigata]